MPVFEERDMDQPRFCYVLTTTGRDEFADMTYASVAFLRQVYPEAEMIRQEEAKELETGITGP